MQATRVSKTNNNIAGGSLATNAYNQQFTRDQSLNQPNPVVISGKKSKLRSQSKQRHPEPNDYGLEGSSEKKQLAEFDFDEIANADDLY